MTCTIGTSFVHCRLDCCNYRYYCLSRSKFNCLQHTQNAPTRAVVGPRSFSPDHILRSLHRLKVQECIKYNFNFTTYKLIQFSSPFICIISSQYSLLDPLNRLHCSVFSHQLGLLQSHCRCFRYAAPHLWNKLSRAFHVPYHLFSLVHHHHPALLHRQWLAVDISDDIVPCLLKTLFKVFSSKIPPLR